MADKVYDVYADSLYKTIKVIPTGDTAPDGMTLIGEYTHPDSLNANELGPDVNHVMFHRIRDLIYKKTGLATVAVKITMNTDPIVIEVSTVSVTPATATVDTNKTVNLSGSVTPTDATNQSLTWSSSDATIATVDETGVVTGVAAGSATITATSNNGKTGTSTVTVTAPVAG